MTTPLEKTLKRQLAIGGRTYVLAISPEGLKLTLKGRRKGLELEWDALVSGDAALAVALNASLGKIEAERTAARKPAQPAPPATTSSPAGPRVAPAARRDRRAGPARRASRR